MKRHKVLFAWVLLTLFTVVAARAYVTLTAPADGDTLTSTIYNNNLTALDDGLDTLAATLNDTLDNRFPDIIPLFWTHAFRDSTAANDSLTTSVSTYTPLGNIQALRVGGPGVVETETWFLDFFLYNSLARLDSIRVPIWTEAIDGDSDYVAFHVFEDSSDVNRFKAKWTVEGNDSSSTVARTAKTISITGINIIGGQVRLETIIKATSDSAFVGQPLLYTSNL